jgi:hypothetical protein
MSEEFNWGELGEQWWREAGERLHADERQIKFAATRQRGASQKEAAICACYGKDGTSGDPKDDGTRRSEGSRVDATAKIRRLLAEACAEVSARGGSQDQGIISDEESLKLFSKDIRNGDPLARSRAQASIEGIRERQAREDREKAEAGEYNPLLTLNAIAEFNPLIADELARQNNIPWKPSPEQEKSFQTLKKKIWRKLNAEFGSEANGHSLNEPSANQQTAVNGAKASAAPVHAAVVNAHAEA